MAKEQAVAELLRRSKATAAKYMASEIKQILEVVIAKAKDGDLAACKLIMERVLPAPKADQMGAIQSAPSIEINIIGDSHGNGKTVIEAERDERADSHGQEAEGPPGAEVEPQHGGEEGHESDPHPARAGLNGRQGQEWHAPSEAPKAG